MKFKHLLMKSETSRPVLLALNASERPVEPKGVHDEGAAKKWSAIRILPVIIAI